MSQCNGCGGYVYVGKDSEFQKNKAPLMGTKHTPTPWEVRTIQGEQFICPKDQDRVIAEIVGVDWGQDYKAPSKANAALIVHRVNLHDELVKRIENMREYIVSPSFKAERKNDSQRRVAEALDELLKRARGEGVGSPIDRMNEGR